MSLPPGHARSAPSPLTCAPCASSPPTCVPGQHDDDRRRAARRSRDPRGRVRRQDRRRRAGGQEFIPLNERHGKPLPAVLDVDVAELRVRHGLRGRHLRVVLRPDLLAGRRRDRSRHCSRVRLAWRALRPRTAVRRPADDPVADLLRLLGQSPCPPGINAVIAGVGWFAVNSVSGALALNTLLHLNKVLCLIIIVLAQIAIAAYGHNLVHAFERYASRCWRSRSSSPRSGRSRRRTTATRTPARRAASW